MAEYLVTPADSRTPAARFTAADLVDLGEQVAVYLTRRNLLSRGVSFDAQVGDERGAIRQNGRVVNFIIRKES